MPCAIFSSVSSLANECSIAMRSIFVLFTTVKVSEHLLSSFDECTPSAAYNADRGERQCLISYAFLGSCWYRFMYFLGQVSLIILICLYDLLLLFVSASRSTAQVEKELKQLSGSASPWTLRKVSSSFSTTERAVFSPSSKRGKLDSS